MERWDNIGGTPTVSGNYGMIVSPAGTLEFVRNCETHFDCKIIWVEAVPRMFFQGKVNNIEDWLNNISEHI